MKFLQPWFFYLFLLVLVPVILHLLRSWQAKIIEISSLYLLYRKKNMQIQLRLHRLLLLLTRIFIAFLFGFFALRPLVESRILFEFFPSRIDQEILVDTFFDSVDEIFEQNSMALEDKKLVSVKISDWQEFLKSSKPSAAKILFSRFYGASFSQLETLQKEGWFLVPFGEPFLENAGILGMETSCKTPFPGEKIEGKIHVYNQTQKERELSIFAGEKEIYKNSLKSGSHILDFSFQADFLQEEIRAVLEKDAYPSDDVYKKNIEILSSLKIAFVRDGAKEKEPSERLLALWKFFHFLKERFSKLDMQIDIFTSSSWNQRNSAVSWDFVIVGDVQKPLLDPLGKKNLFFSQKEHSKWLDERMKIRSIQINKETVGVRTEASFEERMLLREPLRVFQRQLFLNEGGSRVLVYAKDQPLVIEREILSVDSMARLGKEWFFGFDLSESSFSAADSSWLFVFLYKLLLERESFEVKPLNTTAFTGFSRVDFPWQTKKEIPGSLAELSPLVLFFLVLFLWFEVYLIHKNIKILQSSGA